MDSEIVSALETLAAKLGTTSEYLWNVLLKQASISAITDFIQCTLVILVCVFWIKKVKVVVPKILKGGLDDIYWIGIVIISILLAIFVITAFFCFPNIINGLINPEYWALDRLLSKLNH